MRDITRQALGALTVVLSMVVVGAIIIWLHGAGWRQLPCESLSDALWTYLQTVGVTFIAYRFAQWIVDIGSKRVPRWLYARWVLLSGAVSLGFSFAGYDEAGKSVHLTDIEQTLLAIKAYAVLLVAGLLGTRSGLLEAEKEGDR